jgi:hypothetical protein
MAGLEMHVDHCTAQGTGGLLSRHYRCIIIALTLPEKPSLHVLCAESGAMFDARPARCRRRFRRPGVALLDSPPPMNLAL